MNFKTIQHNKISRRTALSLMGGAIAIGLSKYYLGHGILKQNNCYSYGPIAEYIKENQPELHSDLITKVSSNSHPKGRYEFFQSALNYNNVLEELNNLEFILVDGFFLSYSEVEESYRYSAQACL